MANLLVFALLNQIRADGGIPSVSQPQRDLVLITITRVVLRHQASHRTKIKVEHHASIYRIDDI